MVMTEISREPSPRPYTPPSNVITVLQRLRSRNLPERIEAEYLRDAGIPEGTIARTLFAMRFLGLIDEFGTLSEQLKAIHTSTDEEYQAILSGSIKEAYKEVFNSVDPGQDAQDKIRNVFRRYTPASQRDRMVIFFLGMCREAGIPTLDVPRQRAMGTRTDKPNVRVAADRVIREKPREDTHHTPTFTVPPAIEALIKSLPPVGEPMSKDQRTRWVKMAEAVLDFVYPESEKVTTSEEWQRSVEKVQSLNSPTTGD